MLAAVFSCSGRTMSLLGKDSETCGGLPVAVHITLLLLSSHVWCHDHVYIGKTQAACVGRASRAHTATRGILYPYLNFNKALQQCLPPAA